MIPVLGQYASQSRPVKRFGVADWGHAPLPRPVSRSGVRHRFRRRHDSNLFFQAAGTRLTQPQVFKDALAKERLYDRLPALVADTVTHTIDAPARDAANPGGAGAGLPVSFFRQLSPADWETVFGAVLPPDYLRQQTEKALDQYFGWLHSDAAVPVVIIDLRELKQRLVARETEEAYVRILQTKPPCTVSQLESAGVLPVGCCPPSEEMPQARMAFREMMRMIADQIPETVDLLKAPGGDRATAEAARRLTEVRTRLVQMEALAWWSLAVPAALLLLIAVFAVRSFRGWMFWWGIPCLLVGAVSGGFALSVVPAAKWISVHVIVPHLPAEVPAATLEALAGLLTAVVQPVVEAALHSAGALAMGGLAAVIFGAVLKPRPMPADEQTRP